MKQDRQEVREAIELLPNGFVHENYAFLSMGRNDYVARLKWRDGRLRWQSLQVPLTQERVMKTSPRSALTDRQVADVAEGLSAGIAKGLNDHLRGVIARRR